MDDEHYRHERRPAHGHDAHEHAHAAHPPHAAKAHGPDAGQPAIGRLALAATLHCLTGCGIGEVLGMVIGTALGWGNVPTVAASVALAFVFGYLMTLVPLRRAGMPLASAARLALAADTASIVTMEIVDNLVMLVVPGAMDATLAQPLFWGSLALSLALAALAVWPVNRFLIARGRGHAVVHAHHGH